MPFVLSISPRAGPGTTFSNLAVVLPLTAFPSLKHRAVTVVVEEIVTGPVTRGDEAEGTVPSVVYRISTLVRPVEIATSFSPMKIVSVVSIDGGDRDIGGPREVEDDHGVHRVGARGRESDHQRVLVARHRQREPCGIREQVRALRRVEDPGDGQRPAGRPVEDVQVEPGPAVGFLFRAAAPREVRERARVGAVDGLRIHLHPAADVVQALDRLRREQAFGRRTDVQEEVSPFDAMSASILVNCD